MSRGALPSRPGGPGRGAVGIDYTLGPGHAPGAGRYVRELVRALVRTVDAPALRLVEFGRARRPMEGAPLGLSGPDVVAPYERRRLPVPRRLLPLLAPVIARAASRGVRAFHRVDPAMPPRVAVPATLALLEFPASPEALARLGESARAASALVTFSRAAASRAASDLGVDSSRLHVAPVGCEHWARALGEALDEYPRRPTRDVVVLGAVRRSRRPLDVLRAFESLRARGVAARLLVVGRPGDAAAVWREALAASPTRAHVRWIDQPDESRMPDAVAGASALLHLADDEVSPVTPLEAIRLGVPVVASPLPAFREVLEGTARWADPGSPDATAAALADALEEALDGGSDARARIAAPALRSTWAACAAVHVRAWEPMLRAPESAAAARAHDPHPKKPR